jgi:hypothetical protein
VANCLVVRFYSSARAPVPIVALELAPALRFDYRSAPLAVDEPSRGRCPDAVGSTLMTVALQAALLVMVVLVQDWSRYPAGPTRVFFQAWDGSAGRVCGSRGGRLPRA